jgi:hypothetical protein
VPRSRVSRAGRRGRGRQAACGLDRNLADRGSAFSATGRGGGRPDRARPGQPATAAGEPPAGRDPDRTSGADRRGKPCAHGSVRGRAGQGPGTGQPDYPAGAHLVFRASTCLVHTAAGPAPPAPANAQPSSPVRYPHRRPEHPIRARRGYPREYPDRRAAMHRRAARWYERHGQLTDAVRHAAETGDWPLTASIVIDHLPIGEIIQPRRSPSRASELGGMAHGHPWTEPSPHPPKPSSGAACSACSDQPPRRRLQTPPRRRFQTPRLVCLGQRTPSGCGRITRPRASLDPQAAAKAPRPPAESSCFGVPCRW